MCNIWLYFNWPLYILITYVTMWKQQKKYNTSYNICYIYFVESATHKKCKTTKHQRNAVPKTPMHRYQQHWNASGLWWLSRGWNRTSYAGRLCWSHIGEWHKDCCSWDISVIKYYYLIVCT